MKLCEIRDNPGAHKKKRVLGRGIGSGLGKTSGRGGKGQTARSGVRLKGFQGGQMPISRRLPKRGFTNIHRLSYVEVNLDQIQEALENGRLKVEEEITAETMQKAGLFKQSRDGVRLLARGQLSHKVHFVIAGSSAKAREVVESMGGQITLRKG